MADQLPNQPPAGIHSQSTAQVVHAGNPIQVVAVPNTQR